jgi:outer membrane protein OmpA-like peptidoglycan-associated protein
MDDARLTIAQSRNIISRPRRREEGDEFASRAFALASNAIGVAVRKIEAERLEAEIAQRSATIESLEERASEAEEDLERAREQTAQLSEERRRLESELTALHTERKALEAALESLRREKAQLALDKEELAQEKEELADRLQSALSEVAETRSSARGTIVSLPDILFDLNESSLKPEARLVLAKLAGILLIMDDLNLRIEGHTDSTGTRGYNQRLSEARAASVRDFLLEQGVDVTRMIAVGYGPDRPVASNETADGRRQNRRVEIVIAEGEVAAADGW